MCAAASAWAQEPANLLPEGDFESSPEIVAPYPNPITTDPTTAQEGALHVESGDYKNKNCSV